MRVLVTASAHFAVTEDGNLWTPNASLGSNFWSRYLDVYDEVHLMARAKFYSTVPSGWKMATAPRVKAVPVPSFLGPAEYLKNYFSVKKVVNSAITNVDAIQLRIPCTIATQVLSLLEPGRPYGIEVVADPYDSFAPGSVKHPLRPFFRWLFPRELKQQCARATAALYVTQEALQKRYPCPNYSVGVSDVELTEQTVLSTPRVFRRGTSSYIVVFVGSMAQLYKAPNILIDAIASCIREGLDLKLVMVGDGRYRPELEAQAARLGIDKRVFFLGQLVSSDAVRAELDLCDLFVLPSYQEGLPRAMVEAMARALPCIGSTVGGIPELLAPEDIVAPGDVTALALKIREVVTNPERMTNMSTRNLEKAKDYKDDLLRLSRIHFYQYVREQTQMWLKQN